MTTNITKFETIERNNLLCQNQNQTLLESTDDWITTVDTLFDIFSYQE